VVRIAKKTDPKKIAELKRKIHDEEYLMQAIQKIAQDLTKSLEHGE
jgi:anti-sigma28 factor (negative regulator of flagellin synthesis)